MSKKLLTPLLDSLNETKMKARKMYRIELTTLDYIMAKDTALVAALSNGGGANINLIGLQAYANVKKAEMGYKDVTVSLIGNCLLIDKGTELLLKIEEVEVMDLDVPTLTRQEAKDILEGLADDNHEHLLN